MPEVFGYTFIDKIEKSLSAGSTVYNSAYFRINFSLQQKINTQGGII